MKLKRAFILLLLIGGFMACAKVQSDQEMPEPNQTENQSLARLPSGKTIRINSVNRISFPDGVTALMLNYETDIPIENKDALSKEVDEVWQLFRLDVEEAKLNHAIVSAAHYEGSGFVRHGKGFRFLYFKNPDGKWERMIKNEKEK